MVFEVFLDCEPATGGVVGAADVAALGRMEWTEDGRIPKKNWPITGVAIELRKMSAIAAGTDK